MIQAPSGQADRRVAPGRPARRQRSSRSRADSSSAAEAAWIQRFVCNNRIEEFLSDGTFDLTWGSVGDLDGELSSPSDVAADGSGRIYVVDAGNSRVQAFLSDGTFEHSWGEPGSEYGELGNPRGIAADGAGSVYVTDDDRVQKFACP